jgi:phosphoribosylanthranilate isomerase
MRGFAFSPAAVRRWDACAAVDTLVVDGPRGGGGRGFDHAALAPMVPGLLARVLLAGGLAPGSVRAAIDAVRPWGVDVSSGVERERGTKDAGLVADFCLAAGVTPRRVRPSAS